MGSYTRLHRGSLDTINGKLLPIDKTGLVAYYPFWQNTGTTLYDESKTGNDGTINGATWTWLTSFAKPGLHFDGADDDVNVPDSPSLDTGSLTVLCLITPDTAHDGRTVSRAFQDTDDAFSLMVESTNTLKFEWWGPGATNHSISGVGSYSAGETFLLGGRVDGGNRFSVWKNDTEVDYATTTESVEDSTQDIYIGQAGNATQYFDGVEFSVLFYARALSDSEIRSIYYKTIG